MGKDVIIACDFSSRKDCMDFLALFKSKPFIKIGMELFYKEGPQLVRDLVEMGCKIFLDLKLHDIPNTVYKAMRNVGSLGVDIVNCHAAGGIEMMKAAKKGLLEGAAEAKKTPLLIAVTQLTSTSAEVLKEELLIDTALDKTVLHYAQNAKKAGLDGVVCSPLEAPLIKEIGLISVTPGVRMQGDDVGDQKRVATPELAKQLGSTYIVVGRPITNANSPVDAYSKCLKSFL